MRNDASSGFTLIEMLVAMVIVALGMSVAATTLIRSGSNFEARRIAREITTLASEARYSADRDGRPRALVFDVAARTLTAESGESLYVPEPFHVELASAESVGPGRIAFYPGGASSGGQVRLTSPRIEIVVKVDWLTSHIETMEALP
ncbi:prepilin-type N-terminal cleavage/methylation domain-containing protein [Hyphomonas sp.]|jgi:general secretion pathway protein H|uniref:prepilin-type N-terminal cleavage/methylation domain-containing protein n=1 Tax=Hyphomonas sp. TaxID=87 RepID=UPI0039E70FBC